MAAYYIQEKMYITREKNEKFKLLTIFPESVSHCHAAFLSKTLHIY